MATPRKAVEAFRERAELLDFLLEVSRITSETLDLDKLLANVADIVKVVVPYDLFAILLYSERNQGLRIRYSIGHREEIVRSLVIGLGEGIVGSRRAKPRTGAGGRRAHGSALSGRARCRAERTGRAR